MIQSGAFTVDMIIPITVLSKIANKAEDLSKKVTLNDAIKTAGVSKYLITDFEKVFGAVK